MDIDNLFKPLDIKIGNATVRVDLPTELMDRLSDIPNQTRELSSKSELANVVFLLLRGMLPKDSANKLPSINQLNYAQSICKGLKITPRNDFSKCQTVCEKFLDAYSSDFSDFQSIIRTLKATNLKQKATLARKAHKGQIVIDKRREGMSDNDLLSHFGIGTIATIDGYIKARDTYLSGKDEDLACLVKACEGGAEDVYMEYAWIKAQSGLNKKCNYKDVIKFFSHLPRTKSMDQQIMDDVMESIYGYDED